MSALIFAARLLIGLVLVALVILMLGLAVRELPSRVRIRRAS